MKLQITQFTLELEPEELERLAPFIRPHIPGLAARLPRCPRTVPAPVDAPPLYACGIANRPRATTAFRIRRLFQDQVGAQGRVIQDARDAAREVDAALWDRYPAIVKYDRGEQFERLLHEDGEACIPIMRKKIPTLGGN